MSETKKRVPCEVWSRIVGYYRPTRDWNKGAQQAHSERKMYQVARGIEAAPSSDWMELYPANAPDENGAHTIRHRTIGGKGVAARALAVSHD